MDFTWKSIYDKLIQVYNDSQLNSAILDKIKLKEIQNNDTIILTAPDPLTAGWFNENFLQFTEKIAQELYDKRYQFRVDVDIEKAYNKAVEAEQKQKADPVQSNSLNPRYTFDRFVVGPSNDFAHAAALNVAMNPGHTYNPLFIYGDVALGKTHLLQSIAHKIIEEKPNLKVLYTTSEEFTNEFIDAIRKNNETNKFKNKFRNIDVLLIDDIQFLQTKEYTLEELFHTFNKLFQERKQMVFACDRPPKSLTAIEDRLRTRFDSGLTVEIKKPSFETRKAILIERARLEKIDIPDSVFDYIAKHIESDVRMLEGSLTKLIAYASLKKKDISLELAQEILRDKIKVEAPKNLTITDIQKVVSKYFNISINDLKSSKRLESITYPRQIAMFLATEHTSLSLTEIGSLFGGKAHTTVMRSSNKIGLLIKSRKKVKKEIDDILSTFHTAGKK